MRKQLLWGVCLLGLGACSTEYSTLFDFIKQNPNQIEDEYITKDNYILAKRGDRYNQADYIITPQVYNIVATRVTNQMLTDAPGIFAKDKKAAVYVDKTTIIDRYLPEIPETASQTAKNIIEASQMFNLVDDKKDAEYVLESSLTNANTPEIPVIVFEQILKDSFGNQLGTWSDSIRQVQNDDGSWW